MTPHQILLVIFLFLNTSLPTGAESAINRSSKVISELISKFDKLTPTSVHSIKLYHEFFKKFDSVLNPLTPQERGALQKDIDRLFAIILNKITTNSTLDILDKIDKIKDLAFSPHTSELYAHNALEAVLTLYRENNEVSEYDVLISGVLGALGRNPHLSDNFLLKVMDIIVTGLEDIRSTARNSPQFSALPFQKFRNLKSLGKNDQASANFIKALARRLMTLGMPSNQIDRALMGLKEYIVSHPNIQRDVLSEVVAYALRSPATRATRDLLLREISNNPKADATLRMTIMKALEN